MGYATPRRIVTGTFLVLLLWGSSLGIVGLAAAGDSTEELPAEWRMEPHRVGDRGTYTVTYVRDRGGEAEVLEAERPLVVFEWLEPTFRMGADREMHHVYRLRLESTWVGEDGLVTSAMVQEFDSTTREMVAYVHENRHQDEQGMYESLQVNLVYPDDIYTPPCGLFSPLAGQSWDPARQQVLYPMCSWESYWASDLAFVAKARQDLSGQPVLYFERQNGNSDMDVHLWLGSEHAYPLRIAVEDQDRAGHFFVIRLTAFEAGTEPMRPAQSDASVPALDFRPWDQGPSTAGVEHPFPLDEAYEASLVHEDAQRLRDFLAAHEDAYLRFADYHEEDVDGTTTRTWSLQVSQSEKHFTWMMSQRDQPVLSHWMIDPVPEVPRETVLVYDDERLSIGAGPAPAGDFPAVPTVASMQAMWQAWGGEPGHKYGFAVRCADSDCTQAAVAVFAGHAVREDYSGREVASITIEDSSSSFTDGAFSYTIDPVRGESMGFSSYRMSREREPAPPVPPLEVSTRTVYDTALWGVPPRSALAGAGILSLLVGAAYLLWPAIKSGGATALFSRVHGPQVVEHPVRRRILDAVAAQPGIHMREVQRRAQVGRGALDHHVRKLETAGLLKRVHGPGAVCLFLRGSMDHVHMEAMPAVRSDGARKVLDEIRRAPGASLSDVARAAGLSPANVHHHVQRLERAGLLQVRRGGGRLRLEATPLAARVAA